MEKLCRENISTDTKFSDIDKIFGQQSNDFLTNKVIVNTKLVIYKNMISGKNHNINEVKKENI